MFVFLKISFFFFLKFLIFVFFLDFTCKRKLKSNKNSCKFLWLGTDYRYKYNRDGGKGGDGGNHGKAGEGGRGGKILIYKKRHDISNKGGECTSQRW